MSDAGQLKPITAYITPERYQRLKQIKAQKDKSLSQIVGEALDQYLEEQADQIGSRRNFQETMRRQLDRIEMQMQFHLTTQTALMSLAFARTIRDNVRLANWIEGKADLDEGMDYQPNGAIVEAIEAAHQQFDPIQSRMQAKTKAIQDTRREARRKRKKDDTETG